jgi:transposase InsO family protein
MSVEGASVKDRVIEVVDRDMDLGDAIQRIALKWPCYGRPRITEELKRQGWKVGPNRVLRLMRQDNLLCVRKRKFVVTTDSHHNHKVYPNLAAEMTLTGIKQLWVADITYIRLETEFVFLAVVIDGFSRRAIGYTRLPNANPPRADITENAPRPPKWSVKQTRRRIR